MSGWKGVKNGHFDTFWDIEIFSIIRFCWKLPKSKITLIYIWNSNVWPWENSGGRALGGFRGQKHPPFVILAKNWIFFPYRGFKWCRIQIYPSFVKMMKIFVASPGGHEGSKIGVLSPKWHFLAFVLKILNDCSLDFSKILHEVTPNKRVKCNIPWFWIKILVASPGAQKG